MNTFRQIHDYVKVRAEQSPHNLAVSDKHTQISYKTLDHLSDQFSALLKQKGVAKGDLIVLNVGISQQTLSSVSSAFSNAAQLLYRSAPLFQRYCTKIY